MNVVTKIEINAYSLHNKLMYKSWYMTIGPTLSMCPKKGHDSPKTCLFSSWHKTPFVQILVRSMSTSFTNRTITPYLNTSKAYSPKVNTIHISTWLQHNMRESLFWLMFYVNHGLRSELTRNTLQTEEDPISKLEIIGTKTQSKLTTTTHDLHL